ncbi:MAG: hypothetical protein CVT49_14540 [candidate division Zixibacteria bacterium HGW-Zixibacteria-1]|nr:MAG: hypothetical protein CVT49_14540 [candidate division Zixibacteria bacterium HGW-Zixibacteria-1]
MKYAVRFFCILLLYIPVGLDVAADHSQLIEININYKPIVESQLDPRPYQVTSYVLPENSIQLMAPQTYDFLGLQGKEKCQFAFWTINESVETRMSFEYTVPSVGKVVATAWYDCGEECTPPHCRPFVKSRFEKLLEVRGIVLAKGASIPRLLTVVETIDPQSLESCNGNPCGIIMNTEGEELTAVTAKQKIEVNFKSGELIGTVEYSFDEWLYNGFLQGAGIRTIEISPWDRISSRKAYAFYSQQTTSVTWIDENEFDDFLYPIHGPIDIPLCQYVFGREKCPQCSMGPDVTCGYDVTFTNVPHHEIQILNRNTHEILPVKRQMAFDTVLVSFDADFIKTAGGLENLLLRFTPRHGRRILSGSLMNVNVKWEER